MNQTELITAIVLFALSGGFFFLSILQFLEKGPLLNNAYLYASDAQRKTMDKKPYYRQSAIVFCLIGVLFAVLGLTVIWPDSWIKWLEIPIIAGELIYAIISARMIEKRKRN